MSPFLAVPAALNSNTVPFITAYGLTIQSKCFGVTPCKTQWYWRVVNSFVVRTVIGIPGLSLYILHAVTVVVEYAHGLNVSHILIVCKRNKGYT